MKILLYFPIFISIIAFSSGEQRSQHLEYVLNRFIYITCPLENPIKWSINNFIVSNDTRSRFILLKNGTLRAAFLIDSDVIECTNYKEINNLADRLIFYPKYKQCSRQFCNDHGDCEIESSPFNVDQARCFCDPGFRGEFCEEALPTRFFLVVIFWIVVFIEISSLIIAVIRHQMQTIFRLQNTINLRFVDVLNGALDGVFP